MNIAILQRRKLRLKRLPNLLKSSKLQKEESTLVLSNARAHALYSPLGICPILNLEFITY